MFFFSLPSTPRKPKKRENEKRQFICHMKDCPSFVSHIYSGDFFLEKQIQDFLSTNTINHFTLLKYCSNPMCVQCNLVLVIVRDGWMLSIWMKRFSFRVFSLWIMITWQWSQENNDFLISTSFAYGFNFSQPPFSSYFSFDAVFLCQIRWSNISIHSHLGWISIWFKNEFSV